MQRRDAVALQPRAHGVAHLGRDRRHRRQPARQRLEIQPGAADEDRQHALPRAPRPAPCAASATQAPDGIIHRRVDMAVEPVRRARLLVRRRPRREDAQVAIDLHGIGVDDVAAALSASRSASADLPLAVGPAISTAFALLRDSACMSLVATLICNPANPALDTTVARRARAPCCPAPGAAQLARSTASRPTFPSTAARARRHPRDRRPAARGAAATCRSTSSCSLPAARRKKLFLADMDSTMIGQECIDELADFVGLKAHVAAITERAMRGEIEFEPALRERVALLKGLPVGVVDEVLAEAHHADAGRPRAGHDHARARRLHLPGLRRLHAVHRRGRRDDRLSRRTAPTSCGRRRQARPATVAEPILGRDAKLATLLELREAFDLDADRHAGGRRRRQRPRHDRGRRPRRRLSRQARGRRRRRTPASTTATSPRCSTRRATSATSS